MSEPRRPLRARPFDAVLAFCLLAFVGGWLSFDLPSILGIETAGFVFYTSTIDPFILEMPPHIALTIAAGALLYGPLYVVLLWGLWRDARWLWKIALPSAGLLVATSVIYIVADLTSATPPLNLPAFLVMNGVYVVVGLLLIVRFTRDPGPG